MIRSVARSEGWELRLVAEIAGARAREWEWGAHDCACFAASCLTAQWGFPPVLWERLAGRWRSEAGAARVLRREGWRDVGEAFDSVTARLPQPALAMRGDIAAAPGKGGLSLGVAEGGAVWFPAERGLVRLDPAVCVAAWPAEGLY